MGDQDERGPGLRIQPEEQLRHPLGRLAVQVAGRLIRKQDARPVDEGAGQRHPLLLATGELHREMSAPVTEADLPEEFTGSPGHSASPPKLQRHHHVFKRRQGGNEVKTLEDKPHRPVSQRCAAILAQAMERNSVKLDISRTGFVQARTDPEQGRFPAARGSDHGAGCTA